MTPQRRRWGPRARASVPPSMLRTCSPRAAVAGGLQPWKPFPGTRGSRGGDGGTGGRGHLVWGPPGLTSEAVHLSSVCLGLPRWPCPASACPWGPACSVAERPVDDPTLLPAFTDVTGSPGGGGAGVQRPLGSPCHVRSPPTTLARGFLSPSHLRACSGCVLVENQ